MNRKLVLMIVFVAFFALFFSLVSFVIARATLTNLSPNATTAKKHLEELGYKVLSYEDKVDSYTLTEETLNDMPFSVYWNLPGNNPTPYMNKVIEVEKFIVRNHPLDHWKHSFWISSNGKTNVYVYVVEGKVVGGTSYPVLSKWEDSLGSGYWSLEGEETE